MGDRFYTEFSYPLGDYFFTLKKKEVLYELILPLALAIISYFVFDAVGTDRNIKDFLGYVVNCIAILVGFALTFVAILASGESANLQKLKEHYTDRERRRVKLSTYQLILATYAHLIIFSVLTILVDLLLMAAVSIGRLQGKAFFVLAINVFLVFHIIALNIRGVSSFYFILFNNRTPTGTPTNKANG